jgi:hypothetical protein
MTSRRVRSRSRVLLTLLLAACGGSSTGPSTGSLALEVSGLPSGVEADVTVSGPNGFIRLVGQTETLSALPSGTYTVAAVGVSTEEAQYLPSPPTQSVEVSGGDAASAQVLYSSGNSSLAITVSGLPAGTDAAITVSGPGGYSHQVSASETLTGLGPGQYTLTALPVTSGGDQYSPAPSSQTKTVGVGASVPASVSYSTGGAAGFNLRVDGVYLVQSVQTYGRSVPLVQDRDALLRVFVTANQVNAVAPDVDVSLYRDGVLLTEMTIAAPGLSTPLGPDEATLNSSWNVILDRSLIQGSLSIVAEVDPGNLVAEGNEGDNTFPESGTPLALDVRDADPFRVTFVPVITKANGRLGNVTSANTGDYLESAMRMHPLRSNEALLHTAYTTDTDAVLQSDNGNGAWTTVLGEILALRGAESSSRYYYGVVNPSYSGGVAGVGYIGAAAAIGWDKSGSRGSVAAHEWGHNWNRNHAPCAVPEDSDDDNYPYASGQIGVIGYDVVNETLKPADAHDLMGYCSNQWISDYTYLGVMNFRSSEASRWNGMGEAVQPGMLVWGRVEHGRAVLEPAFSLVARPSLPRRSGPYRIEGRSAGGGRVFGFDFAPLEVADDPRAAKHFAFVVPVRPERAARLVSLHLEGPGVRASLVPAAAQAPAVQVTRAAPGRVALRWDASKAPMLMVRDPATGQVLSFARSGAAEVAAPRDEVSITVSDRVRSRELRLRTQSR